MRVTVSIDADEVLEEVGDSELILEITNRARLDKQFRNSLQEALQEAEISLPEDEAEQLAWAARYGDRASFSEVVNSITLRLTGQPMRPDLMQ